MAEAKMFQICRGEAECRCGKTWARDPTLEVACPVCNAKIGKPCQRHRPSGHSVWGWWAHNERDLLADANGCYSHECAYRPRSAAPPPDQLLLF